MTMVADGTQIRSQTSDHMCLYGVFPLFSVVCCHGVQKRAKQSWLIWFGVYLQIDRLYRLYRLTDWCMIVYDCV